MRVSWLGITFLLAACVSSSMHDARFSESQGLSSPAISVTPADPESFSFAVVGDLHIGNGDTIRFRKILDAARAEGDSFIALLGDIADEGEATDYAAVDQALTDYGFLSKAIPVIGNHDIFKSGWENYKARYGASHFGVTIGNSRFLVLDTADSNVGADQYDWLEDQLESQRPRHTFILSHYLPMVPGQRTYLRLSNEAEALRLMKLASRTNVTGWMGAHYHSYGLESVDGVTYLVAGGGGGRRMEPVMSFFFVQVTVTGPVVSYQIRLIPD